MLVCKAIPTTFDFFIFLNFILKHVKKETGKVKLKMSILLFVPYLTYMRYHLILHHLFWETCVSFIVVTQVMVNSAGIPLFQKLKTNVQWALAISKAIGLSKNN